jgi:hypothetical protein
MIELTPATEAEMIAAFLRAEIGSCRYGKAILALLQQFGAPRRVIDEPNVNDQAENELRRAVLAAYRGYPGALLFTGFPADTTWRRVRLEPDDFQRMRYARVPESLIPLSGPSRLVTDGARNFSAGVPAAAKMPQIAAIVADIKQGATYDPLIAVQDRDGSLVLIEGHSRATAYVITGSTGTGIEALAGTAATFEGWYFF